MQMFYLEPLKREIEWRLAAFGIQQSAQVQTKTVFDTRIAMLQAFNASADQIEEAEAERAKTIGRFQSADANISDFLIEKERVKERVEDYLQLVVIVLFAIGTLLAGLGRALEMRARPG